MLALRSAMRFATEGDAQTFLTRGSVSEEASPARTEAGDYVLVSGPVLGKRWWLLEDGVRWAISPDSLTEIGE